MLAAPGLVSGADEDLVEFLSGAKSRGRVLEIQKAERQIVFESRISDRAFKRVYPYSKIHAVTYNSKRYVLNEMDAAHRSGGKKTVRRQSEVQALIDQQGRTPPDWYEATMLEYPETLDLSWPEPAPQPWNNQRNVGQYIWDIVNPNPGKWRSGIRFMHHLVGLHQDDAKTRKRAMQALAGMYFRFFQDYARAAFWWHQAGIKSSNADSVALAECYWRLGNKQMATELLDSERLRISMIKLLGDMGETERALQIAEVYARKAKEPHDALLAAGDACRLAGQYRKAIRFYQRVLDASRRPNEDYDRRARERAQQSIEAIRLFELLDISKLADGTYRGESLGYEGQIEVSVTMDAGRIADVEISRHKEKQFYSALTDVPRQIINKQTVKGVDATSRATITAEAIITATAKALSGGAE